MRRIRRDDRGATAVEYAVVVVLVAVAVLAATLLLGRSTNDNYTCTTRSMQEQSARC